MTLEIQIDGLGEWIARLQKAGDLSQLRSAMQSATLLLQGEIAPYPPASEANVPGQRRWYERGYGPKWMLKDGTVHGKRTSETLGRRWTTKVSGDGMEGTVGNNASYAPTVHSKRRQAAYHARRGWVTDEDAIKSAQPGIERLFKNAIEANLG